MANVIARISVCTVTAILLVSPLTAQAKTGKSSTGTEQGKQGKQAKEKTRAKNDLRAGSDQRKRYFVHVPTKKKAPKKGFKLLIILPGGDGGANFEGFCKRIHEHATKGEYITVQLVAPIWTKGKVKVVWPSGKLKQKGQKFTTPQFIHAVIKDVKKTHKIDKRYIHTLSWSSGGPAAYAASIAPKTKITGSFVAMSVFHKSNLGSLKPAKGKAYYILHSPEDWIKMSFPKAAEAALKKNGAKTKLTTYKGGHGWHGDVYGMMRTGLAWLAKPSK